MVDLIVMGAGLSGLMAAYTAAKAGLSVRVVAKGLGSIHWSAGTIDVLGYLPEAYEGSVKRPFEAIQSFPKTHPTHPYTLIGEEKISQSLATFVALSKEIGMPYGGAVNPGDNLLLPSPAGAARPTYLAPQAQLAGDLSRTEPMLIVGFKGMRDFFPALIAENLARQGHRARAAFLPLSLVTQRRDINTVQLAEALEQPDGRRRLAKALRKLAQPGERIALPGRRDGRDEGIALRHRFQMALGRRLQGKRQLVEPSQFGIVGGGGSAPSGGGGGGCGLGALSAMLLLLMMALYARKL